MKKKSYAELKHNNKERRQYHYKLLKEAGFNSYEANRFKDFSLEKIKALIGARTIYNIEILGLAGDSND